MKKYGDDDHGDDDDQTLARRLINRNGDGEEGDEVIKHCDDEETHENIGDLRVAIPIICTLNNQTDCLYGLADMALIVRLT